MVDVNCEGVLFGQVYCIIVIIFFNIFCVSLFVWFGVSVEVEVCCEGDFVVFVIRNVGSVLIFQFVEYLVIEDQVILLEGNGGVLSEGDLLIIWFYVSGVIYCLEVI